MMKCIRTEVAAQIRKAIALNQEIRSQLAIALFDVEGVTE